MQPSHADLAFPTEKDLAYAVLILERQLNAYQRLHEEDLAALRSSLEEIKARLLSLGERGKEPGSAHLQPSADETIQSSHS